MDHMARDRELVERMERPTTMKHNGPCTERRRWSIREGLQPDWQCIHQSQCRCQCHKRSTKVNKVECLVCDGSGMVPARGQRKDSQKRVPCAVCRGTGQVER